MQLPDWLPVDAWNGWCEMRQSMKRVPFTERAKQIALRQLQEWHAQGYDIGYILDESTMKGWRGLFVNERTPQLLRDKWGEYHVSAEGTRVYRH